MAGYTGMSMEQLHQIAVHEAGNIPAVAAGIDFWAAVVAALSENHDGLSSATATLGEQWQDGTFETAFKRPVDEGLASIRNSEQIITGSGVEQVLTTLSQQMETTRSEVERLYQEWLALQAQLHQLNAMAQANPLFGAQAAAAAARIMQRMEELRLEAAKYVTDLAGRYSEAAGAVQAAGSGHAWNGPTSLSGSASAPVAAGGSSGNLDVFAGLAGGSAGGSAGGAAVGSAGGGMAGAGGAAGAVPVGPDGEPLPDPEQSAGTGLAGGAAAPPVAPPASVPPAAPPTTAPPPVSTSPPPVPVPVGGTVAGAGVRAVPLIPVASATSSKPGSTPIPQAARVDGGITSASTGRPPAMPAPSTGSSAGSTGSGGGVPRLGVPLVPPFLGAAGVPGTLAPRRRTQDGGGPTKAEVVPPGPFDGDADGPTAGVPKALRGRTGRAQDPTVAFVPVRRSRARADEAPETVQLLDEEIWEVMAAAPAANADKERALARR